MPSTKPAPTAQFTVTVTKPAHATVRVGPFPHEYDARGFAHALINTMRGIGAPAGTTADITPYDPRLPHRCVPAADPAELVRQMDAEPHQCGHAGYPDLFTRLCAYYGYEQAARTWLHANAHRTTGR